MIHNPKRTKLTTSAVFLRNTTFVSQISRFSKAFQKKMSRVPQDQAIVRAIGVALQDQKGKKQI